MVISSSSYSLNVDRLRLGTVCTETVGRNAGFLTLTAKLGLGALRLPTWALKDHSPLPTSFLFLPFLPSKGGDYFLGHSIPLVKGKE